MCWWERQSPLDSAWTAGLNNTVQGRKPGTLHTAFLYFSSKQKCILLSSMPTTEHQFSALHIVEGDAYLLRKCCWSKERLFGWFGAWREKAWRRNVSPRKAGLKRLSWLPEALRISGGKKSHCVKLDTAGTLRGFLLMVTDYGWEKRAKKLPYFNCVRAKVGIRLLFRLKEISLR